MKGKRRWVRRGDGGAGGGGAEQRETEEDEGKGKEGIKMLSRDKRREMADGLHPTTLDEIRANKLFTNDGVSVMRMHELNMRAYLRFKLRSSVETAVVRGSNIIT